MIQETTGRCPFLEKCEAYHYLKQFQRRLIIEKRESLVETSRLEHDEIKRIMISFQRKFDKLRRREARCTSYFGWCLKYWQIFRLENKVDTISPYDNILLDQVIIE